MPSKYQAGGGGSVGSNFGGRTTAAGGTRGTRAVRKTNKPKEGKAARKDRVSSFEEFNNYQRQSSKNTYGYDKPGMIKNRSEGSKGKILRPAKSITGIKPKAPVKPSLGRKNKKGKK